MSVLLMYGSALADDGADLEVHDGIPVDAELLEHGIAVLVELGRPTRGRGLAAELHGCRDQMERSSARRVTLLHVPVGERLGVFGRLERVLHDAPLAAEVHQL